MRRSFWPIVATGLVVAVLAGELASPIVAQRIAAAGAKVATGDRPGRLRLEGWPILVDDPQGVFIYATEAASVPLSPYQNNLAIGYRTLNPTTHRSPRCNSADGFDGFCGDEVAFGAYTLQRDVTGRDNTAIGDHALANLISGTGNTAVGSSAAANIRASYGVDAFGVAACQNATDYRGPITCLGQAALEFAEPSSQYTVAVGYQAGLHTKLAEFSTILGIAAGFSATTNSYSVLVGEGACHNAITIRNVICLGTINGPAGGPMTDKLWIGGNNDSVPILFGELGTNALGVNTTTLTRGAALTLAGGNIALPPGYSVQWNGDAAIARTAAGTLAVGNGTAGDASGTLEVGKIVFSSKASVSVSAEGGMVVEGGRPAGRGGHVVAAYVRTVPTRIDNLAKIDPSPQLGDRAMVTDAKGCAFGTAVAPGGSGVCPVYFNGKSWVAG